MADCYCGSKKAYSVCCEPYLHHIKTPDKPEALMRSRYTAYCLADIAYIQQTMCGPALVGFDAKDAKQWAQRVVWIKLDVLESSLDGPDKGYVTFIARFVEGQTLKSIHEKSAFIQKNERWYYVDGVQFPTTTQSLSRNSACPCGSHKKYKQCHLRS